MAGGTAYTKRWGGNFSDGPGGGTPIDSTFLNAVEAALLQLIGAAPNADAQVMQWDNANTRYGPALILNKNIDPAAAIAKSKLDFTGANGIVNADIAGAAAISPSKIAGGVPKITSSLMSGGPPGSPVDGDIWIALAVDTGNLATTTGITWAFRYNASSGSSFKWEFIGGKSARLATGSLTTTSTSYVALSGGATFTLPRNGDYWIKFGYLAIQNGGFSAPYTSYSQVFDNGVGFGYDCRLGLTVSGSSGSVTSIANFLTATAGHVLDQRVKIDGSAPSTIFTQPWFEVTPVRIS